MVDQLIESYGVLGFFQQNSQMFIIEIKEKHLKNKNIDKEYIENEIDKRILAKRGKQFELADSIRNELEAKGIILKDTVEGTIWDIKELY